VLIEEEMGDMLFVMANIARHLKLDPETALRKANDKFMRRFAYIERRLAEMGKTPEQSTLEEMDALWDEVRAQDKARLGHEAVPGTVSGTKSAT
jgi:ATP diphosphatase